MSAPLTTAADYSLGVDEAERQRLLGSLRAWADTWLPDDPDMLERDPDIVLG